MPVTSALAEALKNLTPVEKAAIRKVKADLPDGLYFKCSGCRRMFYNDTCTTTLSNGRLTVECERCYEAR